MGLVLSNDPDAIAISISFLIFGTILLILRCHIRYRFLNNYGTEDIFVICAWVLCIKIHLTIPEANVVQLFAVPEAILFSLSIGPRQEKSPQVVPYLEVGAKTPSSYPYASYLLRVVIDVLLQLAPP